MWSYHVYLGKFCFIFPNVQWNLISAQLGEMVLYFPALSDFMVCLMSFLTVNWPELTCHSGDRIIDHSNQECLIKEAAASVFFNQTQTRPHHVLSSPLTPCRFDFLLWCLCGACHTPTPQQRRLLLASSSVSSVSKSSRAATLPVPALTPARSPAPLTWWRWPSPRPSRLTCPPATAPTAASTAGRTWPTTTSSFQRYGWSVPLLCCQVQIKSPNITIDLRQGNYSFCNVKTNDLAVKSRHAIVRRGWIWTCALHHANLLMLTEACRALSDGEL